MDKNGLYDIYDMMHVPWWQRPVFIWIIGLAAFFFLVVLIYVLYRKFMSKQRQKLPWEKALHSLSEAYNAVIQDPQHFATFYDQVTAILKQYMADLYHHDLVGCTDAEWLNYLQINDEFPRDLIPVSIELLDRAGSIKFAGTQAILDQIEQDYVRAGTIIQQTKPAEVQKK